MNKKTHLLRLLVAAGAILVVMVNAFVNDGLLKFCCNAIAVAGSAYGIIVFIFPRSAFVHKLNYQLRKYVFFNILLGPEREESVSGADAFVKLKSRLLAYSAEQISNRTDLINSPEIFSFDFGVKEEFNGGSIPGNQSKEWKEHLQDQFLFITGASGSGKTFELIKRVHFLCEQLKPGETNRELLRDQKVPLYIELKSLDRNLDQHWIEDYISKSASIANKDLSLSEITALIVGNQVVYFFDGLDEVEEEYRYACVQEMIRLSKITGVHVSCRKEVFKRLTEANQLELQYYPAEYFLKPLSFEFVKDTIWSLSNRTDAVKAEMIEFITNKPRLQRHMSRPIFLNLFIGVYTNLTEEEKRRLATGNVEETMDILWANYEDFIVKNKLWRDSDILGIRTITVWLARIMGYRSFYIESIQPSWISTIKEGAVVEHKGLQKLYYLTTRVVASVIIGSALSCIISTPFALLSGSIIGGTAISVLAGLYNRIKAPEGIPVWLTNFLFSIGMIAVLIIVCGGYQGLALRRAPEEMATPYFSATECWPGVLLGITLSTIFSYRVIMEKIRKQYILPVELFHFDWPHAVKYGLSWGFTSGIIVGTMGVYVRNKYEQTVFIRKWLVPYLQKELHNFRGASISEAHLDAAIFIYAFLVTFFVASILIVLLAGRYNDQVQTNIGKKQKLNYGIKESRRHALVHGGKVGVLVAALYYIIMLRIGMGNWFFCLKISLGASVLAFLWFGGMEVINHRILRINLYLRGIAPLDYTPWVQKQQDMGLIISTGFQMKFYHTTLAGYYMRYPLENNPRIRLKKVNATDFLLYTLILAACVVFIALPFFQRYIGQTYWKGDYDIRTDIPDSKKVNDSTYRFLANGKMNVSASGYIVVGTFVGYACPQGTTCGFMGMPIDSAYNLDGFGKYRHAALLYRIKHQDTHWSEYRYASELRLLNVKKNDLLQVLVNDKEWQNNTKRYQLSMKACGNCK